MTSTSGRIFGDDGLLQRLAQRRPDGLTKPEQRLFLVLQFGAPLGIFGHLAFLVTFWLFDFHVLALFNVFSFAVFSFGYWRIFKGDLVALTYLAMVIEIPLVHCRCPPSTTRPSPRQRRPCPDRGLPFFTQYANRREPNARHLPVHRFRFRDDHGLVRVIGPRMRKFEAILGQA